MDAKEFKAWFKGFCEGVKDSPNPEQWEDVQKKVEELDGIGDLPSLYPVVIPYIILPYRWSYDLGTWGIKYESSTTL